MSEPKAILTQRDLIAAVRREFGVSVTTATIHAWIRAGMPTVPWQTKPRFSWPAVSRWILQTRENDPLTIETRDMMLKARYRGIA